MEITRTLIKTTLQITRNRPIIRTIMTSATQKCEKVLEEIKTTNPYYVKYAEKIAKLQETSPEELLSRLEQHKQKNEKKKTGAAFKEKQFSQLLNPKKSLKLPQDTRDKQLCDVMKIDLIKDKSTEEIKSIWEAYHKEKSYIAAIVPAKEYEKLQETGRRYPTFLFPLPRSQGYEFFMSQFQNNMIHFTPLLYYQVHKENAPECLTLTYFTEFKEDKDIVLMRGEYNTDVVDTKEALCLANQILLYYGQSDESKNILLERFTNKPDEFKHMDLIKETENFSL